MGNFGILAGNYTVLLARSASKALQKLSQSVQSRIIEALEGLEFNPMPRGCIKLVGSLNLWRVRCGEYRIIYSIDGNQKVVDVNAIRQRSDAHW